MDSLSCVPDFKAHKQKLPGFRNPNSLNGAKQHLSLSYANCKVYVVVGFEERLEFFKNGRISDDAYLV